MTGPGIRPGAADVFENALAFAKSLSYYDLQTHKF